MKNKTIYYTKKLTKQSKMYGYSDYVIKVYLIKNGKLEYLDETTQRSCSTPGDSGEVWEILQQHKLVPKKYNCCSEKYEYMQKNNIKIKEIY